MSNSEELKQTIINSQEPLLFKNVLKWQILNWSLKDWSRILGNEKMDFRSGSLQYSKTPQWERETEIISNTFDYFLKHAVSESQNWLYFDYKYLNGCLTKAEELKNDISWSAIGFPNTPAEDTAIWIGSKGAHTPCHADTYGFNLVHQIYGTKLWVLFPPEENLRPTRIPYEESSIFSKLNFFSPAIADFKGLDKNCRKIILTPGDVLLVPHQWWHYVENLEIAISINVWLPLPQDDEERLKESIVQYLVKQISASSNKETKDQILNPNMEGLLLAENSSHILDLFEHFKCICEKRVGNNKENATFNSDKILEKYSFIQKIPRLTKEELISFLSLQRSRFEECDTDPSIEENCTVIKLLEALTHSDVISLVKEKLLDKKYT